VIKQVGRSSFSSVHSLLFVVRSLLFLFCCVFFPTPPSFLWGVVIFLQLVQCLLTCTNTLFSLASFCFLVIIFMLSRLAPTFILLSYWFVTYTRTHQPTPASHSPPSSRSLPPPFVPSPQQGHARPSLPSAPPRPPPRFVRANERHVPRCDGR